MSSIEDIFDIPFNIPTIYYKGDNHFYKGDYQTRVTETDQDLKRPELRETLLSLAQIFSDPTGEGAVADLTLIEDKPSNITKTVIWCDIREKKVKEQFRGITCSCSEDGQIILRYEGIKVVFDPKKYHGLTLDSVRIKKTVVFLDEKNNQERYVDVPLKAKYLSMFDDSVQPPRPIGKGDAIGRHLEYSVKLKGRNDPAKFLIPVMKTTADINNGRDIRRGTILLWPKFKKTNWKAYFMYCDIEDSQNTLSFAPVLEKNEGSKLLWDVLPPVPQGLARAITSKKEGCPRYLIVREKVKGEELGFFTIALDEVTVQDGVESWGIDFGTQGSVVAFSPSDGQTLPFYLRKDYSYMILEGKPERQKAIRDDVRWFPTYPSEDNSEGEPYVLTQLAADVEQTINRLYRKEETIPVEHFNIVSVHADTEAISKRLITELKWPGTITSSESEFAGRREARKGYLTLLLMMSLAERIFHDPKHSPAVNEINPTIAYPLRMGTSDVKAYAKDFEDICNWVSEATGFKFKKPRSISESRAASFIAGKQAEVVIADLGGGTLDLWMGNMNMTENNGKYEISTDSIRVGGLNLLGEISQLNQINQPKNLGKMYLQTEPEIVGESITQSFSQVKTVYLYYSFLIHEYIARFILGHIKKNYGDDNVDVQFITVGNGWKLFSCYEKAIGKIPEWIVSDVQERVARLVKEFQLPVSAKVTPMPYNEKKSVAFGAAKSYMMSDEQLANDKIKTTAGIEFKFHDNAGTMQDAKWMDRVPFEFSRFDKHGMHYVHIPSVIRNNYYSIPPDIDGWKGQAIPTEVFVDCNTALSSAKDLRLYDKTRSHILLQVSPFSVLCEKILNSFKTRQW